MGSANQSFPSGSVIVRDDADMDILERKMYQLATASRQPINLLKLVADAVKSSDTHDIIYPSPTVQSNQNCVLFKLAVLLPKRTPGTEQLHDTLRSWVTSHPPIGHASSQIFKKRSHRVEVRVVAVIGNE